MSSDEEEIQVVAAKEKKPRKQRAPKAPKEDDEDKPRVLRLKEFDMSSIPPQKPTDKSGVKIVVIGKPGCFALNTKVLMFDGSFKYIQDVVVGDQIMGDDTTVRTVEKLITNNDVMYQIKPIDGYEPYVVNQTHDLYLLHVESHEIVKISVFEYLLRPQEWQLQHKLMRCSGVSTNSWSNHLSEEEAYAQGQKHDSTGVKTSSIECRRQYMAGLIDAFGTYVEDGVLQSRYKIETLNEDDMWIARSLGCWASHTFVYGQILPTRILPQLQARGTNVEHITSYFEVLPLTASEYYGFECDGNHNFLLYNTFDAVSNTGKSSLIADIIWYKSNVVPVGMVFSGTEDSNHFYSTKFPSICVHNKLDLEMMKNFVVRQKLAKKYLPNPWAFQIIDDCTDNPTELKKPIFQAYYKNGRHWSMVHILSLQYCMDISTVIRTNVDYTFILRETNFANRERLHKNFVACVHDFQDFQWIMDQITEDFTALVVNNRVQSNNVEDCLFWYKANPSRFPENWKFGCQDAWKFHEERYDEEYSDPVIA